MSVVPSSSVSLSCKKRGREREKRKKMLIFKCSSRALLMLCLKVVTTTYIWCHWQSVKSRWLDIGQSLLRFYGPRLPGQYPARNLGRTSLAVYYMDFDEPASASGKFSPCGTQSVIPSEQNSAILPARETVYSVGFGSSFCPLMELDI